MMSKNQRTWRDSWDPITLTYLSYKPCHIVVLVTRQDLDICCGLLVFDVRWLLFVLLILVDLFPIIV